MERTTRRIYIASAAADPGQRGEGVIQCLQDPATGELHPTSVHVEASRPTFLTLHQSGRYLYATRASEDGGLTAIAITVNGELNGLGSVSTGGAGACHVAVHPSGRYAVTAHYDSGHVAVNRIRGDGSVGEQCDLVVGAGGGRDPRRQDHAHAHFCWPAPDGRFIVVVDLGTDSLRTYPFDIETGHLGQPVNGQAPPGSGPRHLVMHTDGYLLVTGELDSSLMTFSYDNSSGEARFIARVPASGMASGGANAPSELALGPSDRYCYVANRGPNSISVFLLQDGEARFSGEVPSGGQWPRHIKIIDDYLYVANQESDSVSTFLLDPRTGIPQFRSVINVPRPYCIVAAQ